MWLVESVTLLFRSVVDKVCVLQLKLLHWPRAWASSAATYYVFNEDEIALSFILHVKLCPRCTFMTAIGFSLFCQAQQTIGVIAKGCVFPYSLLVFRTV